MRKLPVIPALSHGLKSTWHNLGFAFHASWPWLAILIPFNLYFRADIQDFDPATTDPAKQVEMAKAVLNFYLISALSVVIYSSIGVTWHRYILQDETPQGAARLRLDKTVWRYFGNTILVALLVVLSVLPLAMIFSMVMQIASASLHIVMPVYLALALLIALPVTYRFSLKLPAIAVENRNFKFGDAWNVTRGNMLQLIALGMAVFAGLMVLGFLLAGFENILETALGSIAVFLFAILRQLIGWVIAIFTITMLTSLYGFFVENRDF
jgi:hypothetical protein